MMAGVTKEKVVIRHIVDLSPDEAFDAWINPKLVEKWWGPEGYRTVVEKLDARPGGDFIFQMTAPSGASCPMTGTYTAIERPTSLSFEVRDHCVADMPDTVRPPAHPSHVVVAFEPHGDKTEIIITQAGLNADYQLLAEGGWGQSLTRLAQTPS